MLLSDKCKYLQQKYIKNFVGNISNITNYIVIFLHININCMRTEMIGKRLFYKLEAKGK